MGGADQGIVEDKHSSILYPPHGEGICRTIVCEGVEIIYGVDLFPPPRENAMIPEITVTDLSQKLNSDEQFILLDVREPDELNYAKLNDNRLEVTPMSQLAREGPKALSPSAQVQDATVYVMCHHGTRSAQVTAWLAQQGWKNVFSVKGGIDEYARKIDNSIGFY